MSILSNNLPSHNMYVELFSGSRTMLFEKLPLTSELYNDTNGIMGDFFEVIRMDSKRFTEFLLNGIKPDDGVKVERWDDLKLLYSNFKEGIVKGNLNRIGGFREIDRSIVNTLDKEEEDLSYIIRRLRMLQFENRRFDDIINRFDFEESLFYIDVTKLPEDVTIKELVFLLLELKGKGILYGADSEKFAKLIDEGWKPLHGEGQENMWVNFSF